MRPVSPETGDQVGVMIAARERWLRACGKESHGHADALATLIGEPDDTNVAVALYEDDQVVGCTALLTNPILRPGWTVEERQQHSLIMTMTHTHPDYRGDRIGLLMTMWVCDFAVRLPEPRSWVRSHVRDRALASHYSNSLGWEEVRFRTYQQGRRVYLMQRRANPINGLSALISSLVPVPSPHPDPPHAVRPHHLEPP